MLSYRARLTQAVNTVPVSVTFHTYDAQRMQVIQSKIAKASSRRIKGPAYFDHMYRPILTSGGFHGKAN